MRADHRVFYGHDDYTGDADGIDVLVTLWHDGSVEVALRPGRLLSGLRWGPPVALEDVTGEQ